MVASGLPLCSQRANAEVHDAVAVNDHDHDDVNLYVNVETRNRATTEGLDENSPNFRSALN